MKGFLKKIGCILTALVFSVTIFSGCNKNSSDSKNIDNSFSMIASWTTSGLINHFDSNTSCTAYELFVVEGLWRYVRSTDEIYCQIAAELPIHSLAPIENYKTEMGEDAYEYFVENGAETVTVTTGKIRDNAKWQNGEDFVTKDVWAYYYIMHPVTSTYLAAVKVVDNKTVEFIWNPLKEPVDTVKNLLLAQDKAGTVKYDVFASFVDPVYDIVMASPVNKNLNMWGAFNRISTSEQATQLNIIRNNFYTFNPSWYIATGPFKPQTFSPTQILLVKNEYYWNAQNINFERIKLYSSSDLNQTYSLVRSGNVDYLDGFIQKDTLESMLQANSDLVNLKMYDPYAPGIVFNLEESLFTPEVRKAFQYILNREEITLATNPYATTSYYPLLGMAPSEAKMYMSEENFNKLPKYAFDQVKATELLEAQGWTKTDGKWYDAEGKQVKLTLGANTDAISSVSAEAAAAQFEAFGIEIDLLISTNFFGNAEMQNSPYDMAIHSVDLNMSFSYPTGSYSWFNSMVSKWIHLPRYSVNDPDLQKAGNVQLVFDGYEGDTKTYEFAEYINYLYSLEEEDLTYVVDVFNGGLANMNLGIQFFQNVTAATYNVGKITGVPLEEYWSKNRNVTYIPEPGTDDFFEVAKSNLLYAPGYMFSNGIYSPNNK